MPKNLPKFNQESYIHYITTKTFKNYPFFKNEKCCLILLEELDFYRNKLGFKILGYVVMPDHFHCLIFWDVEKYKELTIGKIMQGVKGITSYRVAREIYSHRVGAAILPHLPRRSFWQKGFYDFNIYTFKKFKEKLNYIHNNPVRVNLCKNPQDYYWSSCNSLENNRGILKIDKIEI